MKKVFLVLGICLLITSFVTAGGQKESSDGVVQEQESVELLFWHTYSDAETILFEEQVLPEFMKTHPGIKVKSVRMPYDGLKQQVIAGVAGDAAPDLMRMDIVWVPEFAKLGALEEISSYSGFDSIKSELFEGPLATNYYKGAYYGLPLNTNTKIAVYNKQLLKRLGITKLPETMDEFIAMAKPLLQEENVWPIAIGGSGSWGMLPWFWTMGGTVTNEDYTKAVGYFNSADSIKALTTLRDWYREGIVGPSLLGEEPNTWGGMENANYLMMDDGPWYYSIVGDSALENTMYATLPAGPNGSISVVGGENLVLFKTSRNKEAAWTFMKWMLEEFPQVTMAQVGMIPTTKSASANPEVTKTPYVATYIKQLETANPRTPHPNWEKISEVMGMTFERVFRGEAEPAEALNKAALEIEALLQE